MKQLEPPKSSYQNVSPLCHPLIPFHLLFHHRAQYPCRLGNMGMSVAREIRARKDGVSVELLLVLLTL